MRDGRKNERSASIISVTRIGELGTKLGLTSNRRTLRIGAMFLRNVGSYKSHNSIPFYTVIQLGKVRPFV
jgi:hypothetical protein